MRSRRSIICLYSLFLCTTLESPYVNVCVYVYSHDPSIFMTWLTRRCNMTHSYVWHDSFVCDMISLYLWYDAFVCDTWRTCVCDMTHPCVVWLIHVSFVCGTCRILIVGCDACVRGTWGFRTWDVTHSYVGRDSYVWYGAFVCVTWRIHMCDTTRTWMSHVTHAVRMCDMTHSYVWHNSHVNESRHTYRRFTSHIRISICVICLIHMHGTTHSSVCHHPFSWTHTRSWMERDIQACDMTHAKSGAHIHGTTQPHDTTRSYVPRHITLMSCNMRECHAQTYSNVLPWVSLGVGVISSQYIRISCGNVTPKLIHKCHVTSHWRLDLLICATSRHSHVICHTRMSHLHSIMCPHERV